MCEYNLENKNSQIRLEDDFPVTRFRKLKQLDGEIGQQLLLIIINIFIYLCIIIKQKTNSKLMFIT